jgi:hypothetical protein
MVAMDAHDDGMTYHRYAIRTLTALALAIAVIFGMTDRADSLTAPPPDKAFHQVTDGPGPHFTTHCAEDEVPVHYPGQVVCWHIEGDGWYILRP